MPQPTFDLFARPLDRAAHRRTDEGWLRAQLDVESTLFLPVWRDRSLLLPAPAGTERRESPSGVALGPTELGSLAEHREAAIFLGTLEADEADEADEIMGGDERALFALPVPAELDEPPAPLVGARWVDLRRGGLFMSAREFHPLAYARGMARWNRITRFCERCGAALQVHEAGFRRVCAAGHESYPRTDPAVMILVRYGDEVLLARQPGFPPGMVSALAGFVEVGESLEDCVRRETREEVGLEVQELRYFASEGWPFPRSLMVAYEATVDSKEFRLDTDELEEAFWVKAADLENPKDFFIPPPRSLAHRLIRSVLTHAGGRPRGVEG